MERLVAVTRFDQLKVGDLIFDLDCHCKRSHYAAIMGVEMASKDEHDPEEDVFELTPNCCGIPSDPESITAVDPRIIRENRIYLVRGAIDADVERERAELVAR